MLPMLITVRRKFKKFSADSPTLVDAVEYADVNVDRIAWFGSRKIVFADGLEMEVEEGRFDISQLIWKSAKGRQTALRILDGTEEAVAGPWIIYDRDRQPWCRAGKPVEFTDMDSAVRAAANLEGQQLLLPGWFASDNKGISQ